VIREEEQSMTKKAAFGVAVALAVATLAARSASASCNPPKRVGTYEISTGRFVYFHTTLPNFSYGDTLLGKIWSPAGDHTGTCNNGNQTFLYFTAPNSGNIGVDLSLGEACVVGCPSGSLSLQITASKGNQSQTIVAKVVETPFSGTEFDFSALPPADLQLGDYPRPRVTSSSRVGTMVNLTLGLDNSSSLFHNGTASDITGYNIVSASSTVDPGANASGYAVRSFIAAPRGAEGSGAVTLDCSNIANDQWVAFQLVSAIGGPSNAVGTRFRMKCDPALANPHVAPKKGMGTGTSD
jgi:hypothetical protein